jgi:transcriptional regulator with AAA-type ATPase domain/tetratricopeptide (TPR) repeat protein
VLSELIGESPGVMAVRQTIERLLARRASSRQLPPIFIEGETGSGKGLVARAMHQAGPRASRPFVDINCAAIPDTLVEAELFGFERGAFTDARQAKAGLFQTAHGGTIFLDEIGLVPDAVQAKLLKVIEDREVRRLGSTRSEPVDVWIITATNEDLRDAVRLRRFRADLYHRLSVVPLKLPPLRERGRDVLLLAEHFLARACAEYRLSPRHFTTDARAALLAYRWPGNVRELANVIERVALLSDDEEIDVGLLELPGSDVAPAPERGPNWLQEAVAGVERQHLVRALEETGWNLSRAAAKLGVPRNTLRYRITRLGLAPEPAPVPSAPPARSRGRRAATGARAAAKAAATSEPAFDRQQRVVAALRIAIMPRDANGSVAEASRVLEMVVGRLGAFGARLEQIGFEGCAAFFGVEPAEDAPRRAASAAIAVKRGFERLETQGVRSVVRLAIEARPLMLGRFGETWELDPPAKQDLVERLGALVDQAEPGAIVIGEGAAPFLERRFEIARAPGRDGAPPGPRTLTGAERSGYELWGRITRFVGRTTELESLALWVDAASRGQGGVVGVVGEPGAGKSRLLFEVGRTAAGARVRRLHAACPSYGTSVPFLPALGLLRQCLEVEAGEAPAAIADKIVRAVAAAGESTELCAPLSALFDALPTPHPFAVLAPSVRRHLAVEAVSRLCIASSRREPLLVVVEDLHWIDPESQAVLDALVARTTGAHLLLVATYRPEYQHRWAGTDGYTELRIGPLSRTSSTEMLDDLVGTDPSLESVKPQLLERTEGNPFFLEESVRTLVDDGVLAGTPGAYRLAGRTTALMAPPTVRAVLAARIDRLAPARRRLLQCASVIGRTVSLPLLARVADAFDTAVAEDVAELGRAQFVTPATTEATVVFKHALTQEVAYESVADLDRRALHARVLAAMETLDPGAEHAEVLAEHAIRGEVWDRAVDHLRAAGANAYARGALDESIARYERALGIVARLPASRETAARSIDVRLDLHAPLMTVGRAREIAELYPEAERLARELGDGARLGQVLQRMSQTAWLAGRYRPGADYAQQALAVANVANDDVIRFRANYFLGLHRYGFADYLGGIPCFSWLVDDANVGTTSRLIALTVPMVVPAWCWLGLGRIMTGQVAAGEEALRRGVAAAEGSDYPQGRVMADTIAAVARVYGGTAERSLEILRRTIEVCERIGFVIWLSPAYSVLGVILTRAGHVGDALPYLERSVTLSERTGVRTYLAQRYTWWAEALLASGKSDDAQVRADSAIDLARAMEERAMEAEALLVRGMIADRQGDREHARRAVESAVELSVAIEARAIEANARRALGRLLERAGQADDARRETARAEQIFAETGLRPWWPSS